MGELVVAGVPEEASQLVAAIAIAMEEGRDSVVPSAAEEFGLAQDTVAHLRRSLDLAVGGYDRVFDDYGNAKRRAARLEGQLSRALNKQIQESEVTGGAERFQVSKELDDSNVMARGWQLLDYASVTEAVRSRDCGDISQLLGVYSINLAFELLMRVDSYLHFRELHDGPGVIRRSIEFPAEYLQAGVTVLSHFASILRDRYAGQNCSVEITQVDNQVTLVVKAGDNKEEITRTLDEYAQVVQGQATVDSFAQSAEESLRLQFTMDLVQAELKAEKRLVGVLSQHLDNANAMVGKLLSVVEVQAIQNSTASRESFEELAAAFRSADHGDVADELHDLASNYGDEITTDELKEAVSKSPGLRQAMLQRIAEGTVIASLSHPAQEAWRMLVAIVTGAG